MVKQFIAYLIFITMPSPGLLSLCNLSTAVKTNVYFFLKIVHHFRSILSCGFLSTA